jgi:hypothetical protein
MTVAPEATAALIPELEAGKGKQRQVISRVPSEKQQVGEKRTAVRRILKDDGRLAREAELLGGEEEGVREGLSAEETLVVGGDGDLGRDDPDSGHSAVGWTTRQNIEVSALYGERAR